MPRDGARDDPRRGAAPTALLARRAGRLLFVATTFASAFLIFLIQPLVAKRIVPWFGGVPAVWSLCLAFYQTTLFAGYAYAHLLIRSASPRRQIAIHAAFVGAAALTLPVLPSDIWKPDGSGDPSAAILAILLANVALPFFALAATGPLVAVWFSRRYPSRSPYPLYAVSNFGSLLALLAYPFWLEPGLPLSTTGRLWSVGFVATGAAVIACAVLARRAGSGSAFTPAGDEETVSSRVGAGRVALWILLSACGVGLLMAVTNALCLDVASVPFLWIVPLAIYLVSLILCFGTVRLHRPYLLLALPFFATVLAQQSGIGGNVVLGLRAVVPFQVSLYGLLLFAVCMALHGELYRLRPAASSLTAFYLCTSAGGALGGLAVGLGAPHVFGDFYELPLGLGLACVLLLAAFRDDPRGWLGRSAPAWRWAPTCAIATFGMFCAGTQVFARPAGLLHQERSFFGVLRVEESETNEGRRRSLKHGSTLHGFQIEGKEDQPTSYYGLHTGIGIALARPESDPPAEIGVIGLGAGTLAAYGRPGDHVRMFEIDPAVVRLARDENYFSYVARSAADVSIVEGDGRISLARERARNASRFDYLIVDAYSSDAVPVHLLTREALALYLESLQPTGLLAIHISSRHFDLMPVVSRLAADIGVHTVKIESAELPERLSGAASWVFMARDPRRVDTLVVAAQDRRHALGSNGDLPAVRLATPEMIAAAPLWTDDYSNLFRGLRLNRR